MATSGSTNWTVSRNDIIKAAIRACNGVASGETPSASEISEASEALNFLIKSWQNEDIGLWLVDTGEITLVADQQSYTLGTGGDWTTIRPLEIVEARFYNATSGDETPMFEVSWDEYQSYPSKDTEGQPTNFHYKPNLTLGVFYIWPTWDDTTSDTIRFSYKTVVEDFDSAANNPDFPTEWFRCLKWNLADEIKIEYAVDEATSNRIEKKAIESKFNASAYDREKAEVYFELERR